MIRVGRHVNVAHNRTCCLQKGEPGEELEKLAKEVITKDADVIERMKKLLGK